MDVKLLYEGAGQIRSSEFALVEFLRLCMLVERYCMLVFSSFDRGIRPTRAKAPAKLYDFAFLICKFSNSCLSKYYSILLQLTVIRQGVSFWI